VPKTYKFQFIVFILNYETRLTISSSCHVISTNILATVTWACLIGFEIDLTSSASLLI